MVMDHQALMAFSTKLTSTVGGIAIMWTMFRQFLPYELKHHLLSFLTKLSSYVSPYDHFLIEEYNGERLSRHELYVSAKAYLSDHCSRRAHTCRIELGKDSSDRFLVSIGDRVEVTDDFNGARIWWHASKHQNPSNQLNTSGRHTEEERRYYTLTFHKRHRELIEGPYLRHVLQKGRAIMVRNRQRRLFTNSPHIGWSSYFKSVWSHVPFQHPSTFDTLAMDPIKKQEIIDDLIQFRRGKDYYSRIGKAWKRGYLLYGPPGTGKSSMISAIANFLEYDIYDLELTTVKSNSELRKLFIETTGKSIIVIEDIDCSLDLTGKRERTTSTEQDNAGNDEKKRRSRSDDEEKKEMVTLSGLLNFIDGLWSACGEERILIFTTNHIEKLDPALIRTGRMDKHIEMSYCDFESFKVLAQNYLGLGIERHELYGAIRRLLEEVQITPADVAESLMCVGFLRADAGEYLEKLIRTLRRRKEAQVEEEVVEDEERHDQNNLSNGVKDVVVHSGAENGVVVDGNN
jgi:Domain associated at C-terminal with AAA/ATPase family associated with various cellular activities (AAA)